MGTLSTHVLDTSLGGPAANVEVRLETMDGRELGRGSTDADGRVGEIGPERLESGHYRLWFDSGDYFGRSGAAGFYPEVVVAFTITDPSSHYHVPVLLSPFGYSTYRGS